MSLERSAPFIRCKGCNGPLACKPNQTMVAEHHISTDENGEAETVYYGGWCGDCVDEWNRRLAVRP